MIMKLKDGKSKVLTFSYDDGVKQDIRLVEIFNRYGLKGTFNINSGQYLPEEAEPENEYARMKLSEAKALFTDSQHEVALHGYEHKFLKELNEQETMFEILEDKKHIEKTYGVIARGMAYAFGNYNEQSIECMKKCGVVYSRTVFGTDQFEFPEKWLELNPTCHHSNEKLMEFGKFFVEDKNCYTGESLLFYVWGHSYEFDINNDWHVIENFAEYISGKDDVWYATNIEIYDYVKAYEGLILSEQKDMVYNPSALDVWFYENNKIYCVKSGETISL